MTPGGEDSTRLTRIERERFVRRWTCERAIGNGKAISELKLDGGAMQTEKHKRGAPREAASPAMLHLANRQKFFNLSGQGGEHRENRSIGSKGEVLISFVIKNNT